jgi:MtfA peptidase
MRLIVALIFLCCALWLFRVWKRNDRRRKLRRAPFPETWRTILERNVSAYPLLPTQLKTDLEGHVNVFLHEKNFEGAAGLEITDEIRVTIAAHACMLLLNRTPTYYPQLCSIIVYPAAYVATPVIRTGHFESEGREVRFGEAWRHGAVVLSWHEVLHADRNRGSGHNVGLHEFAHQLDFENGASDGIPVLADASHYLSWARVMSAEFAAFQRRVARGKESVLDEYGTTDPGEFFAVATEAFFEKPRELQQKHPRLFAQLRRFFRVDPTTWQRAQ